MVLEDLITTEKAERHPLELFFIGFIYASVAILLSVWIFKQYSSLVMVFLTVVAAIPLMYNTLKYEEKEDTMIPTERGRLREHSRVISFLVFLFLGMLIAFSFWYVVLPANLIELMFKSQIETISSINAKITGNMLSQSNIFVQILLNNVKVLLFTIFFAFFYGAGALFILTWNASVIAAAIGTFIRNNIASYANYIGWMKGWAYFNVFSAGLMRYLIHGIPEITAYFIGGLAGGIISVAMINHDLESKNFKCVMLDSLSLIIVAISILVIAGLIEVYITPALF